MSFQQIYDVAIDPLIYDQYVSIISPYIDVDTRVIDVGCGTGKLLSLLSSKTSYLYGFDIDNQMITYASSKYPSFTFKVHDMHHAFPYYADIIILSMDVIHFSKEPMKVLSHAIDALEDDGIIIFDYFIKPLSNVNESHQIPFQYHWNRTIKNNEIHHQLTFLDTHLKFIQYDHRHLNFIQFFKDANFNILSIPSVDPMKEIIVAKR